MAIELNLNYAISDDGLTITVTDNTGAYSSPSNTGGYGTPNPSIANFSDFLISIYLPDPVTLLPSSVPVVIDAYSALPSNSNGTFDLTALNVLGSATTKFIDGWYQFIVAANYDTGLTTGTVTATNNLILYAITDCCITNMTVKEIDCGCSGASTKLMKLSKANLMLDQLRPRTVNGALVASPIDQCGQYNEGVNLLLIAQDICDSSECKGCGGCG
jgi:hypothetical protein